MRRCLILYLIIGFSVFSFAQDFSLSFNHLSRVDGLSNDVNPYVYKDSRGFVWIGSTDGLNRFDGEKVTIYRPNVFDSTAVSGNIITSQFFEDNQGNLWFTTYGGINCYVRSKDNFKSFTLKDDQGVNRTEDYHAFHLDVNGKLWLRIGLREKGRLYQFDINNFQQSEHGPLRGQRNYVVKDRTTDDIFIVSTLFGVIDGMEISSFKAGKIHETISHFRDANKSLPVLKTNNVLANDISEIIFGSDKGLGIFSGKDGTFKLFSKFQNESLGRVWSVAPMQQRYLFISTANLGVLVFDKSTEKFVKQYQSNDNDRFSIRSNRNYEVYIDRSNCLWISNWVNGLDYACLGKNKFGLLDHENLKGTEQVVSMLEGEGGIIWVSTRDKGILGLDKNKNLVRTYYPLNQLALNKGSTLVQSYLDRNNRHWIIARDWSSNKSFLYYQNTFQSPLNQVGSTDTEMTSIAQLSDGRILLTTKLGVADVSKAENGFEIMPCKELADFIDLPFYKIFEDDEEHVFFTSNFDRILIFNISENNLLIPVETLTQMGNGTDFLLKGESDMWVTSTTGLFKINRKAFTYKSQADQIEGLSSESMLMVVDDSKDNLWIKTQADIIKYNLKENSTQRFGSADGIQFNESIDLPHLQLPNGEIWLAGPEGITYFYPDSIKPYSVNAQPQITDIFINAEAVQLDTFIGERKKLKLKHNQNTLSFNFVACEYSNPERSKYRYRMTNYDPSWTEAVDQGLARYANIPWGNYAFEIQASNSDGMWSKEVKSLSIEISPPWWATWWAYLIYVASFLIGLRAYVLFRSRKLQEQNVVLEKTVKERTNELAQSLSDLKATQAQLIQSEKMASLGEVTAGIAHEMQNPLNFVNNFSEVSKELVDEVYEEIDKGEIEEVKVLVKNIEENIERIHRHGKRAEGIVRNLLEHSRAGSRHKDSIDLNVLCKEFVRMSYQNMRSREPEFNCQFNYKLDATLPSITAVAQEIGKVLLNIFNNAFYAMQEKKERDNEFEPLLSIASESSGQSVELRIRDNGVGIPNHHLDKIFQPFYTTKPTGKATGLGLSLAYDIIQAHGGMLKITSVADEWTEVLVRLPVEYEG